MSDIPRTGSASRVLAVVALCLLLCGCSSATIFFYNRLHIVLPWYLERYVNLNNEQEEAFDLQLGALLDWHRREELPRYLSFLDNLQAQLDKPVTAQYIAAITDRAEEAWLRLRDRTLDELLVLGAGLSDEQIGEFIASLEKKQAKYARKYLDRSDGEYREDSRDSLVELLEDYLGRLEEQQLDRVEKAGAALIRSDSLWLSERQRWIDMLRVELQRQPGWQLRLREQIQQWEENLNKERSTAYENNTREVQAAVADVLEARSDRQDERLRRELAALREDLAILAADLN